MIWDRWAAPSGAVLSFFGSQQDGDSRSIGVTDGPGPGRQRPVGGPQPGAQPGTGRGVPELISGSNGRCCVGQRPFTLASERAMQAHPGRLHGRLTSAPGTSTSDPPGRVGVAFPLPKTALDQFWRTTKLGGRDRNSYPLLSAATSSENSLKSRM
jgi:hypothetical protein